MDVLYALAGNWQWFVAIFFVVKIQQQGMVANIRGTCKMAILTKEKQYDDFRNSCSNDILWHGTESILSGLSG